MGGGRDGSIWAPPRARTHTHSLGIRVETEETDSNGGGGLDCYSLLLKSICSSSYSSLLSLSFSLSFFLVQVIDLWDG